MLCIWLGRVKGGESYKGVLAYGFLFGRWQYLDNSSL
jgi:hypothetical protein